jgi:hypothetical protein
VPELSRIDPLSAALPVMDYQVDALTRFMPHCAVRRSDRVTCLI